MPATNVNRRTFLAAIGIGSAAAVAAVATRPRGEVKEASATAKRQGRGYQVTEHVQNYYRTAKV